VFAAERRRIVTVDIEGALLHGVMISEIYMGISGQCLDVLLYNYEDKYSEMIYHNKVYVRLDRAAKVWYDTLSTYLIKPGLELTPGTNASLIWNIKVLR